MSRHFSQFCSSTTPALFTTMSICRKVSLACLKDSEKSIKFIKITNGKFQNITKNIFYQKFNSLLAPFSSRALVTSHLFPITLPSP